MVCTANTIEHKTVYTMDFETMHCRLAHPSGEVLGEARKYIEDFPDIKIPTDHVCPGCAQGKMTNKTFPSSERCISQPFELIHCQGRPRRSPEIQSTLVWSSCWGATGSAGHSTQRGEQRRVVRARGNKGEVGVTRDQCRVW